MNLRQQLKAQNWQGSQKSLNPQALLKPFRLQEQQLTLNQQQQHGLLRQLQTLNQ